MSEFSKLIHAAMSARGVGQKELALAMGVTQQAVSEWVSGGVQKPKAWKKIADFLDIPIDEAQRAVDTPLDAAPSARNPAPNAGKVLPLRPAPVPGTIPVVGRAAAGEPGKIVYLNEVHEWIPCPPELIGVEGAYATYVHGDSMQPRYFNNERVYVHPARPYGPGDFVVAQIGEGDDATAYVKQFVSWNRNKLVLHQYNPDDEFDFDSDDVSAVHLIVGSGRG